MANPALIHTVRHYGHAFPGRFLCDVWLYVVTDRRIMRGDVVHREDLGHLGYYDVTEVLVTHGPYQKFRVAKLLSNV